MAFVASNDAIHEIAHSGDETRLAMYRGLQHFNVLSSRGHSVIYSACRSPRPSRSLVELIVKSGAEVNLRNKDKDASCPQHGLVKSLAEAAEDLRTGRAPEHVVCERMKSLLEVLNFLLQCGLDTTAVNVRNRTAHDEFLLLKQQLTASRISIILQIASVFESTLKPGSHTYALPHPAHAVHSGVTTESGMHRGPTGMFSGEHGRVDGSRALYQASAPPATAAHQSWFCKIFGFEETDGGHIGTFAFVRSQLHVARTALGAFVFTTPQGKKLWAGRFTQESLCNLHGKLQAATGVHLTYQELPGDVSLFHRNPALSGSLFQVASQFNVLEMTSPDVEPSAGITIYEHDRTQGPVCAMACPAGTVFRNYFVNGTGQDTPQHQINGLQQAHTELMRMLIDVYGPSAAPPSAFWEMRNGYCMPLSLQHLQAVSHILDPSLPGGDLRRRRFMDSITFGTQWDTQVGDTPSDSGPAPTPIECCCKVAQIYCSALPVAYNPKYPSHEWTHFATAVLQAAYEATFAAAAVLSRERQNARVKVFLTRVGGGVFGNDAGWIQAAIDAACSRYSAHPIDIHMVNFRPGADYSGPAAVQSQQHHAAPLPVFPLPLQQGGSCPVFPQTHQAGHAVAGPYSAGCQAAPSHAMMGGQYDPAFKQQLDKIGHRPCARQLLDKQLDELWDTAYAAAKHSGAVHAPAFDSIWQLNREGKLSSADVAAWVNRQQAGSGFTLLHQIAWHGGYERQKKVFEQMGADKELLNNHGLKARQIAVQVAEKAAKEWGMQ